VRQWVSNNEHIAIKETDDVGGKIARVGTTRSTEVPMPGNIAGNNKGVVVGDAGVEVQLAKFRTWWPD
jgi:hypothetical protein